MDKKHKKNLERDGKRMYICINNKEMKKLIIVNEPSKINYILAIENGNGIGNGNTQFGYWIGKTEIDRGWFRLQHVDTVCIFKPKNKTK